MNSQPEVPKEVLGLRTKPVLELNDALRHLGMATGNYSLLRVSTGSLRSGFRVFPLVQRVQSGQEVNPEDVRPYLGAIKDLAGGGLKTADRTAFVMSGLGIGIPLRRKLNSKIEQEFVFRVPKALQKAGPVLPRAEPYVELIENFENPREEFVLELNIVAQAIRQASRQRASSHGRNEVSATDAGYAIRQQLGRILLNEDEVRQALPMVSELVSRHLPAGGVLPEEKVLAIAAPEIMDILDAALPQDQQDPHFIASLEHNPHPLRSIATIIQGSKLYSLKSSHKLLSSIRDLLPSRGSEAREIFERIKDFTTIRNT